MAGHPRKTELALLLILVLTVAPLGAEEKWQTLGLLRVRDMTPFGINRLDFLPPHAVSSPPGTFAIELNYTHQNTWALSHNVREYLEERHRLRSEISPKDIQAIFELPGEAYLVDGEFDLLDLTLHYRFSPHFGAYLEIPYYSFDGGFLDAPIESFHDALSISDAGRPWVPRGQWLVLADLAGSQFLLTEPPASDFGDPVLGLRWSALERPERWNLVVEAAAKITWLDRERLISTGSNDYGVQVSWQRFFRRNALYLTGALVFFGTPERGLSDDHWLPTAIVGWERRLTRAVNFVAQLNASRSTIQKTELDELSANKYQGTLGLQWLYRDRVLRFGITENIANFDNTPDIGVTFSLAHIFRGGRRPAASP